MTRVAPKRAKSTRSKNRIILFSGVTFIALIVVIVLVFVGRPRPLSGDTGFTEIDPTIPRGLTRDGLPFLGEEDAIVTIVEYEDFGCHNCRDFALEVEPNLIEQYIRTGKVRLISHPVAFVNVQSLPGAEAAVCAAEQGRYWEYRHSLFANQGIVAYSRNNLIEFAGTTGMDVGLFSSCIDQRRYQDLVIERTRTAQAAGINGTPTFEIDGNRYEGVLRFESPDPENPGLVQIIEGIISSN